MDIKNIYNNNSKNIVSEQVYNSFNDFIFSNDTKVLGKLLHRYNFFNRIIDLPGDIVEVGVFKGSGIATFSKFIEIFIPNSNKKVIGFDIFNPENSKKVLDKDNINDNNNMNIVYNRVNEIDRTIESVYKRLDDMKIDKKYILIEGDVEDTIPAFLSTNPGFRISLLYMDVDIERPTYNALKNLWDRILPGGIIIFDEYEYHSFSESCGVDKFLKEKNIEYPLKSTHFMAPTAYFIKKDF